MRFTKMEGIGNDYIYINGFEEKIADPAALAIRMSRYHFGCYSDGLILILPSDKADFRMQMFNSDGSEAEMCGNGVRCVAKYVYDRGLTKKTTITLETGGGIKTLNCHLKNGVVDTVTVDMGAPELEGSKIPSTLAGDTVVDRPLVVNGEMYRVTLVNVGNPHCVLFVDDPDEAGVEAVGRQIERDAHFPNRINVEFAHVINQNHVEMRVWERGTGETLACGTGACATMVAACLNGLIGREADITLRGGSLHIRWDENDNHIYMTGPCRFVYDGEWLGD